jgi:hypothetical protein
MHAEVNAIVGERIKVVSGQGQLPFITVGWAASHAVAHATTGLHARDGDTVVGAIVALSCLDCG